MRKMTSFHDLECDLKDVIFAFKDFYNSSFEQTSIVGRFSIGNSLNLKGTYH